MGALTWQGERTVSAEAVPHPRVEVPTGAGVRTTTSGPCGSDLHLHGAVTGVPHP